MTSEADKKKEGHLTFDKIRLSSLVCVVSACGLAYRL